MDRDKTMYNFNQILSCRWITTIGRGRLSQPQSLLSRWTERCCSMPPFLAQALQARHQARHLFMFLPLLPLRAVPLEQQPFVQEAVVVVHGHVGGELYDHQPQHPPQHPQHHHHHQHTFSSSSTNYYNYRKFIGLFWIRLLLLWLDHECGRHVI